MGLWTGFFISAVVCFVTLLMGVLHVVAMPVVWIVIGVCVAVCTVVSIAESISEICFDLKHIKEFQQIGDLRQLANGKKWLKEDILSVISSPLLVVYAIVLSALVLALLLISELFDLMKDGLVGSVNRRGSS